MFQPSGQSWGLSSACINLHFVTLRRALTAQPTHPPAALTAPHGRRRRTPSGSSPGPSCGSPISRMAAPFPRPSTSFQHQSPSTTSSGQFHHCFQHNSTDCDRWGYLRMCGGSSKMKKEHLKTVRVSMPRCRALCRPVCAACLLLVYSFIHVLSSHCKY